MLDLLNILKNFIKIPRQFTVSNQFNTFAYIINMTQFTQYQMDFPKKLWWSRLVALGNVNYCNAQIRCSTTINR
ncbi:MAG: hypothetical protein ABFS45_11440, partial [Pseudomonadota bacterium]